MEMPNPRAARCEGMERSLHWSASILILEVVLLAVALTINKAYDLLNDYDLRVHGETNLRVQHTLMTLPG